ncbi:hypothetical protein VPH35_008037 [Triticum aestivum]
MAAAASRAYAMPRLLNALRVFAALTDIGLRPHAGRVSVSASWVPMSLCASWACRCGGQGPPFLFGFPLFFFSCFSFCARSLRPLVRALFVTSLRPVRTPCPPALHHGHPFLHWCCWLSFLGFRVGSFVGTWVIPFLLASTR